MFVPAGFATIAPYRVVEDGVGAATIMLSDATDDFPPGIAALYLQVADADRRWREPWTRTRRRAALWRAPGGRRRPMGYDMVAVAAPDGGTVRPRLTAAAQDCSPHPRSLARGGSLAGKLSTSAASNVRFFATLAAIAASCSSLAGIWWRALYSA